MEVQTITGLILLLKEWQIHKMNIRPRPSHIEEALCQMNTGQWFTWTDSKNKIYANLQLTEKYGGENGLIDNPVSTLPTESEVNAKLKELQDAWDSANG